MQKETVLQKLGNLLNTSSETFMLIALVSLFVMPIVMAKNLEPVVRQTYTPSFNAISTQPIAQEEFTQQPNVLGATVSKTVRDAIVEDKKGLEFFENHSSSLTDKSYSLTVETTKRFAKVPVFKIINSGTSTQSYDITAKVNGDLKVRTNQQKVLYIDDAMYNLDEITTFPQKILVSPGQEVNIALMSNRTNPSSITVNLVPSQ